MTCDPYKVLGLFLFLLPAIGSSYNCLHRIMCSLLIFYSYTTTTKKRICLSVVLKSFLSFLLLFFFVATTFFLKETRNLNWHPKQPLPLCTNPDFFAKEKKISNVSFFLGFFFFFFLKRKEKKNNKNNNNQTHIMWCREKKTSII